MAGQRQYEFAVEVIAGPPNSVFRHTKVVTVKSKFMVENQTGMPIEIKQVGTPDLDDDKVCEETRCARRLEISERWDRLCAQVVLCTPCSRSCQPYSSVLLLLLSSEC